MSALARGAFGQHGGTLTGVIADPTGAVVSSASIQAKNSETGAVFHGGSSATGNYTLALSPGIYELSVTVAGFRKHIRENLELPAAITVRWDVMLVVGDTSEAVTVTGSTPLLKTDSGEVSHNVTGDQANELPVLTIGSGTGFGAIRNPLAVTSLLPGAQYAADFNLRVNGLPSNTETIRIEGQDATFGIWRQQTQIVQQGAEAVQELAVQTSNYSAEFGPAAGGYFNFTMKSGTNRVHGSVYDYYVNEFLNAGIPYTDAGATNSLKAGQHIRNRQRRNDYGGTLGGPLVLPGVYDGHDRTFFFFNWEQFRETQSIANASQTVPTLAYRKGDFSTATPLCVAFTTAACPGGAGSGQLVIRTLAPAPAAPARDQLGRTIPVNGIYDPASTSTLADGSLTRDLFPGARIPLTSMDKVALAIQNKLPLPTSPALINNYSIPVYSSTKVTGNPSIKIDHSLSNTRKVSGYLSRQLTFQPNHNGLDEVLTGVIPADNKSTTVRMNYDQTIAPTVLLHLGAGYLYTYYPGQPFRFDQSSIGLNGFYSSTFPNFGGLFSGTTGGNLVPIGVGTFSNQVQWNQKPTANAHLTWIKNNHSFKFGGELVIDGIVNHTDARGNGIFGISADQTRNPWENGPPAGVSGQSGFGYASFLLGQVNSLQTAPVAQMKLGNHGIGIYAQDNWKVTRKLTIDFGLRYDFQTYLKEQYGRLQNADFNSINAKVGFPGTVKYEGFGPGRCDCNFSDNYPWALGPRLAFAYQLNSKTVLRGGSALSYGTTPGNSPQLSSSLEDFYTFNAPGFGANALDGGIQGGNPYAAGNPYGNPILTWPNFDPNKYPVRSVCPGTVSADCYLPQSPFISIDEDARPPRIFQYSLGVQREVGRDLVVDVSYVGNRGVWFAAPALNINNYNTLQLTDLARFGIDATKAADLALLTTPLGSAATQQFNPTLAARGLAKLPYQGFPITQTLAQSLVARPQWGSTILAFLGPPLGKTWYDALQVKASKRTSHGLDMQGSFTYGKELALGVNSDTGYLGVPATTRINDVFNRDSNKQLSPLSQPIRLVISGTYTTPRAKGERTPVKVISQILRDWQIGAVLQYQSGTLIQVPQSNNGLYAQLNRGSGLFGGAGTFYNFAPGKGPQDVFLNGLDPNCHCFDVTQQLVLNKDAWTDVAAGEWSNSAAYYNNYRWQRQPSENMNFGRNFRTGREGRMNLQIRAEFQNVFNRHFYGAPSSTNPATLPAKTNLNNTALSNGFGFVNFVNGAGSRPRTGLMVARFTF